VLPLNLTVLHTGPFQVLPPLPSQTNIFHLFPLPASGPFMGMSHLLPIGLHISLPIPLPAPISRSISKHPALHPKDGGSKVIQNLCILPQHHIPSQPRKPQLEWEELELLLKTAEDTILFFNKDIYFIHTVLISGYLILIRAETMHPIPPPPTPKVD